MAISRDRAKRAVERALSDATPPEDKSMAWDAAWMAIRKLESRKIGDDAKVAEELAARMRIASKVAF